MGAGNDLPDEHPGTVDVVAVLRPAAGLVRAIKTTDAFSNVLALAGSRPIIFATRHGLCLLSRIWQRQAPPCGYPRRFRSGKDSPPIPSLPIPLWGSDSCRGRL